MVAGHESSGEQGAALLWSARLGAHLEASRTQAGLRRVDLAQRLGVSEESIRLWERGAVQPSEEHLVRLIPMLSIESSFWQSQEVASAVADEEPELARRLREERAQRSLTQAALAAELGVPQATYAGWETGRTTPSPDHFALLAGLLGLSEARIAAICAAPLAVDYEAWPAFGQLVGARRQELRLTRADLAALLGVSSRAVMSWELGYRRPQPAQITALASALGVPSAELVAALPQRSAPSRLGALILSRQRELGLQSTDVARLVGTTEPTVSRWINGHSRPGARNLERLAEVLNVPRSRVQAATQLA